MHKEENRQYDEINLLPPMLEQGWCILLPQLLTSTEHDTREKVFKTMSLLMAACRNQYQALQRLSSSLIMLRSEYENLAAEELREGEQDGYFLGLLNSLNSIIEQLR